ncbi:MAG: hypothetical protein ACLFN8_00715 [Candidatus Woesearchaeota archaeon]
MIKSNSLVKLIFALLFFSSILVLSNNVFSSPFYPSGGNITYVDNYSIPLEPGVELISSGGHIHVVNIEASQPNPFWRGYVGNISGRLKLGDGSTSLFDWIMDNTRGKIYASRSNTLDWNNIRCANNSEIILEDSYLGFEPSIEYSVNRTFSDSEHESFYTFFNYIETDSCKSAALNVYNNTSSRDFEEVILSDNNSNLIFSSVLQNGAIGFNNNTYDFQLILPENQNLSVSEEYYFYIELI